VGVSLDRFRAGKPGRCATKIHAGIFIKSLKTKIHVARDAGGGVSHSMSDVSCGIFISLGGGGALW
jgi:hypothetical protein